jgi:hypothetical protein
MRSAATEFIVLFLFFLNFFFFLFLSGRFFSESLE